MGGLIVTEWEVSVIGSIDAVVGRPSRTAARVFEAVSMIQMEKVETEAGYAVEMG